MSKILRSIIASGCLLLGTAESRADSNPAPADPALGKQIDDVSLRDFHGNVHSLASEAGNKPVVLAILGTECPLAKLYAPRLQQMARDYASKGVVFVGIDANWHDTPTKLAAFAAANKIEFPLLIDPAAKLADHLGAARTPEIFLLDAKRVVRYHGRIDDQFAIGVQREKTGRRDLAAALDDLLAGQEIARPSTPFTGCLIARANPTTPHGDITYTKHIAPIFNRSCVECHRDGELAPFPLTAYQEVLGWTAMIREVVSQQRMPPWFASAEFGKFTNDCSLSPADKQTIFSWIDNGCPEGNPADLPERPKFTTGWRMGSQPDFEYRMEKAFAVPAEGTVEYQYFVVEPSLKQDAWVTIAEARPGNVGVVHHIVLFAVPPDRKVTSLEDAQVMGKMIAVYAPGMPPWKYPAGTAMKIEKGSQLVIQMHYTPNGTPQEDRSYVGLKVARPEDVKKRVRYNLVTNPFFEIPPGDPNYEVRQATRIAKDLRLINLFPHMHYRGKSFRFEAEYPDGSREVLLDVPNYQFSWQLRYDLAEPKLLPKGTRLICTAHFDNSEANPYNPDPTKAVRFGLQSWEEMLVGYYTSVAADDDEELASTER